MFALVLSAPAGAQSTWNVNDAPLARADAGPDTHRRATTGIAAPYIVTSAQPAVPRARASTLDKGVFLVASPELSDPNFSKTVVLLVDYDASGAMGVVINRPTQVVLASVLPHLEELEDRFDRVYFGGPVARNQILLLIRSKTQPKRATHVTEDIYVSVSRVTLREMLDQKQTGDAFHAYAGYAGWASGQLEDELTRGDWQVSEADPQAVFHPDPSKVWPELIRQNSGLWVRGPHRNTSWDKTDCRPGARGCAPSAEMWRVHAHLLHVRP
ncbi:MAG: hypothetical protein GWN84_07275 [Gammaproteobacteria bacterium]|nr:hypothetical protein [Gammaproteobacteria bacterium]NIR82688.1 hypothetical protein [Gammaproteobacteria bacterium]NIR89395.1 hypothetical protein [Gammaproteobacteria bacterium]NIU03836.1 hypothetical protein [Gammaproteobacteria bacterium]NIV51170.1 hypothetical protein [Gammaproteobacteria bacterium]